ncbi:MAG: TolC family protein [Phycisphaerae bacterium]|nr:TolC family protein [Phycisphaerae bacterium]
MNDQKRRLAICLSAALALSGCATVEPRADYERANRYIADVTGQDASYNPADEAAASKRVEALLASGLSASGAVELALLNNPTLQAAYRNVGIACADVVQSGLLANPSLGLSIQFPEAGGRSNIQASLAQNIVELWQIPVRRKAAEKELDAAILDLARQAAELTTEVRRAYYAALSADAVHEIARKNVAVADRLLAVVQARKDAGNVGELDLNLARGTTLEAKLELQQARLAAHSERRRLATLLGLTLAAESLELTDSLTTPKTLRINADAVVAMAKANRLDLSAARRQADSAAARLHLEYLKIFPEISIGPFLERSERRALGGRKPFADAARASIAAGTPTIPAIQSRGERNLERRQEINAILGPSISITLPIFDQNQAQIAKAEIELEKAQKQLEAIDRAIVQEVRQRVDQAQTACHLARFYATDLTPQADRNLELSQETYRAGRTSLIVVLDAQRILLAARRSGVLAEQSAAAALADLELSTGRPLEAILAAAEPNPETTNRPDDADESRSVPDTGGPR